MDDRNGNLYPSALAAQLAGVPEEHIREVDVVTFRGHQYVRNSDGSLGRRVQSAPPPQEDNPLAEPQKEQDDV